MKGKKEREKVRVEERGTQRFQVLQTNVPHVDRHVVLVRKRVLHIGDVRLVSDDLLSHLIKRGLHTTDTNTTSSNIRLTREKQPRT